jgi:hypothetical protein
VSKRPSAGVPIVIPGALQHVHVAVLT